MLGWMPAGMADGVAVGGKEPGAGDGVLVEGNGSSQVKWSGRRPSLKGIPGLPDLSTSLTLQAS